MSFAVVKMLSIEHLAYYCVAGVFFTLPEFSFGVTMFKYIL